VTPTQSLGHLAFVPDTHGSHWEYWERDGSIWRQNVNAPVMPDGYRGGRWYAYAREAVIDNLRRCNDDAYGNRN
jgi:hypothetical protein